MQGNTVSGSVEIGNGTVQYLYLETDRNPQQAGYLENGKPRYDTAAEGAHTALFRFDENTDPIRVRYGISYIGEEQAKRNPGKRNRRLRPRRRGGERT